MATKDVNDVGGFAGGEEEPLPFAEDEKARGVLQAALLEMKRGDLAAGSLVEWISQRLQNDTASPSARSLGDVLGEAFEMMDARAEGKESPITTPWDDLNYELPGGGYWPGCHILVSGTGAGKTAWALQLGLHAARKHNAAIVYVGLELDEKQIALRFAGEIAQVGWSKLYTGQASLDERRRARDAGAQLSGLPIYIEAGDPMGWCAARLHQVATDKRKQHPGVPLLIVVDFLQLIGSEPDVRQDLRERIGRAAYIARDVAKRNDATVLLISSVARDNYAKVNGLDAIKAAGVAASMTGEIVTERFMRSPDAIVGLGKESGEIEYAADTVTAALGLPKENGKRVVVFGMAKVRAGTSSWCSLVFDGFRFANDPSHGRDVLSALQDAGKNKDKPNGKNGQASNGTSQHQRDVNPYD